MASACSPEEPGDPSAASSPGTASVAPATADNRQASPGVYDDRVVFGQSAAFSGPAQALGQAMRMGIEAAFNERNAAGGVHGRMLELVAMDDRYEPGFAYANTSDLIAREQVFGADRSGRHTHIAFRRPAGRFGSGAVSGAIHGCRLSAQPRIEVGGESTRVVRAGDRAYGRTADCGSGRDQSRRHVPE